MVQKVFFFTVKCMNIHIYILLVFSWRVFFEVQMCNSWQNQSICKWAIIFNFHDHAIKTVTRLVCHAPSTRPAASGATMPVSCRLSNALARWWVSSLTSFHFLFVFIQCWISLNRKKNKLYIIGFHHHHHHHLFWKRPLFHAKLGLDVCPKSSPSTYP